LPMMRLKEVKGKKHGFGKEIGEGGEIYEGFFANGFRHGEGEIKNERGASPICNLG
jgi:hypothetical protein